MTAELKALKAHFITSTQMAVDTMEESHFPHWKRLVFNDALNCDQLKVIQIYIKNTFSSEGTYSHRLPKLGVYKGSLCLSVDTKQIQHFILTTNLDSYKT